MAQYKFWFDEKFNFDMKFERDRYFENYYLLNWSHTVKMRMTYYIFESNLTLSYIILSQHQKKVLGYRSSFHIMQLTVKNTKKRIKSYIETHHSEITHNYYNFNARYWQSKLEFTYLLIKRNWQENNEQNLIVIQWKCFIIIFSVFIANFSFGLFFSTIFLYILCPVKSLCTESAQSPAASRLNIGICIVNYGYRGQMKIDTQMNSLFIMPANDLLLPASS